MITPCHAFPFIITALTGIANEHNGQEPLTLTAIQASWLGKFHKFNGFFMHQKTFI